MDAIIHLSFLGPGGPEILVVMLALLVMFGARDAPRIFRKINGFLIQLRTTAENFRHEMMYSDIKADAGSDDEFGDYDDYGLSADEDAESGSDDVMDATEESAGDGDEHEGEDVKPL